MTLLSDEGRAGRFFPELGVGSGYFTLWLVTQAAVVGLLLGWIVVEPQMWWRHLLAVVSDVLITAVLYHVYRYVNRAFDWLEGRSAAVRSQSQAGGR